MKYLMLFCLFSLNLGCISEQISAQTFEKRVDAVIKANQENTLYAERAKMSLEEGNYYNLSAHLANLKVDSSIIYESLRLAIQKDPVETCNNLIQFEYIEKTKKWGTPLYILDKDKFIAFCDYCRSTVENLTDPSQEESEKTPFKIDYENKDLLEVSIIIRERDQMVRLLEGDNSLMQEVDRENFLALEYILEHLQGLSMDQKSNIISNLRITMHHQPDVAARNKYKEAVINCQCVDLTFMNGAFQYRTDKIASGIAKKK